MSTTKVAMTDYLPINFGVRKHENLFIWTVKGTDMKLDSGLVKLAIRYPAQRERDCKLVGRLEIAFIKGAISNGGKTFSCQPFDVSKSGTGAQWLNVKANSTAIDVITGASRLTVIEQKIAIEWATNNLTEDRKTTASLRLVPASADAAFEFTTRINYHPDFKDRLAKMPVGIDKFVFAGNWSLIDSDSQAVGNWGNSSATPVTVTADAEDFDLAMFGEVPSELSF